MGAIIFFTICAIMIIDIGNNIDKKYNPNNNNIKRK